MSAQLHRKTPMLTVVDSRDLPVRHVAYWRSDAANTAQPRITRQEHNVAGQLIAQWDPRLFDSSTDANLTNTYSLSGKSLMTDSVDAGWRLSLTGDAGQVLRSWDQRGSHWQTTYDNQLRPTCIQEQATGQTLRVVERLSYGDNSPESAAHNLCGALIRHDDSAGTLLINQYDLTGNPLGQTRHFLLDSRQPDWPEDEKARDGLLEEGDGHETAWEYDALGEHVQQVDAGKHQQHFSFDVAGQLKTIDLLNKGARTKKTVLKDLRYNAFGQVESQTAGNGVISRAVFDPASGRLTSLSASVSSAILQDLHYTYDATGNVLRIEDRAQSVQYGSNQRVEAVSTFTYDSLYQLVTATGREASGQNTPLDLPVSSRAPVDARLLFNYAEHYEYDAGGNLIRLRHVRDGNNYTRTFNVAAANNRLQSWNKGDSTPEGAPGFDACGNQQTLNPGQVLEWNLRNQLTSVKLVQREDSRDDIERYDYDSGGQRVRKLQTTHAASVIHTQEVRYLPGLEIRTRNNERLEVITLQAGRCNVRYLHWTTGLPAGIADNQWRYSLDDHLGSSAMELDDQALLISQESYLPYGGTAWAASRSAVEADYRTIRYCGKERDASGLYYYGHRYYAPWLQRWISPDPAGAVDGLNLYCMVGNNPVCYIDTLGTTKEEAMIKKELSVYPKILSEVQKAVSTVNYQLNNSFRNKDIYKRYGQSLAYNLARNALATTVGVVALPAGPMAAVAASSATSLSVDQAASSFESTRHLPLSLMPQSSRLDTEKIEKTGRTAFYNLHAKSQNVVEEHDARRPQGQKKPSLLATRYVLGKVTALPGAWVANFEASVQTDTALRGLQPRKIEKLNNALHKLDNYLQNDAKDINEAFAQLGVEEFYPDGPTGFLKQNYDAITGPTGSATAGSIKNADLQRDITIARATIQRGKELLYRHSEYNKQRTTQV